jgi:hypothetical protein
LQNAPTTKLIKASGHHSLLRYLPFPATTFFPAGELKFSPFDKQLRPSTWAWSRSPPWGDPHRNPGALAGKPGAAFLLSLGSAMAMEIQPGVRLGDGRQFELIPKPDATFQESRAASPASDQSI